MAELRKLTTLEGDAGVWATLTLARRGDKEALPRAVRVFRLNELSEAAKLNELGMATVLHRASWSCCRMRPRPVTCRSRLYPRKSPSNSTI